MSLVTFITLSLTYCSVSPRNLPRQLYEAQFKRNLRLVSLTIVAPLINFLSVFEAKETNVNDLATTFYTAFAFAFPLIFSMELVAATVCRLLTFVVWEPDVFLMTPKIPTIVLPWVLREQNYRPKRITLFVADFMTSCLACPVIEEFGKLFLVKLCLKLPRNFARDKKGRRVKIRADDEKQVVNINPYVVSMLVASWGIKFADVTRRVLLYSRPEHGHKAFYAICRGVFPIQELCGCLTALQWARRDVLGVKMGLVGLLFPAVFIHGMANFRGMKPIFKWNSATPWSEMQLGDVGEQGVTLSAQVLNKGFAKFVWATILLRVTGYCIKNYYLINRQARKRTVRNIEAFEAELSMDKMLKGKEKSRK